jgi:hypothetical protein
MGLEGALAAGWNFDLTAVSSTVYLYDMRQRSVPSPGLERYQVMVTTSET